MDLPRHQKFPWRVAAKIALREARSSPGKFGFVLLAVAVGVGALSGVRGFSAAFSDMLLGDARQLMAGDMTVRVFHETNPREDRAVQRLRDLGADLTRITETVSMATVDGAGRPLLVSVKAVDPAKYPFYGEVELRPAMPLAQALGESRAVVSDDVLLRLGLETGDSIRLGDADFEIVAAVVVETDRMTGSFNLGPRVMITREGLDRAALILPGSRAAQRYLFKLPPETLSIDQARRVLERGFDEGRIADFRETHPTIQRGLDRATNFLSLVSLVALIIGALGVAMAMYAHLQQRLDTIAIMKCLGARSGQIIRIYLLQTIVLGLVGSIAGIILGLGVQAYAPRFISRYFDMPPHLALDPMTAIQGIVIGVATTALFTLPPLLEIRRIRPALVFRRDMAQPERSWSERLAQQRPNILVALGGLAALGGIATWLGESLELGLWFLGGLIGIVIVLALVAQFMLWALRKTSRRVAGLPSFIRHGIANLHRPGLHAGTILVALGIGVTFTSSVYLVQSSVLVQLNKSAPPEMPNVFLINVSQQQRAALEELLAGFDGLEGDPELVPSVTAKLKSVDGVPLQHLDVGEQRWRYQRTQSITWSEEKPEYIDVLEGAWWGAGELATAEPLVSVQEGTAENLGLGVGSRIVWGIGAREVEATVAAVHRAESIRPGSTAQYVLTPGALEGMPVSFFGGFRMAPSEVPELQRAAFERFPTVTVLNVADVLELVKDVVDQISSVIQFMSGFAIAAGIVILVSSIIATRFRRIRETAILKTLGATRSKVGRIFSVEFLVIGGVAGLMGALLSAVFSALLVEEVLDSQYTPDLLAAGGAIVATALLANISGRLATARILTRKPIEVLRDE